MPQSGPMTEELGKVKHNSRGSGCWSRDEERWGRGMLRGPRKATLQKLARLDDSAGLFMPRVLGARPDSTENANVDGAKPNTLL